MAGSRSRPCAPTCAGGGLRQVDPNRLGDTIELPFGKFPLAQCSSMPSFDVMHHHGQVAYIQTMLGDQEDHFQMG